ncbi:MAG: alpha/beta fold hydrolase [Solirubrobacteraceae bacterium]
MTDAFTPEHRGGNGSPLVCLHGLVDTWRSWDLVLPELERHHDVLAPTLPGHAGGPPLDGPVSAATLADGVERAMDAASFETAHIAGNSLGGFVALQLAERGRARSVVALAPGGGWRVDDGAQADTHGYFLKLREAAQSAAPHVDAIVATSEGRRAGTEYIAVNFEHIPGGLIAHQILGVAGCQGLPALVDYAARSGWHLDPAAITCPVRIVWGTADRILPWPAAAVRFREEWVPQAEWIELDGVGHCPQLDVPLETAQLIAGFTA